MRTTRSNAIITGVLFILASTTAIIGYYLYGPIIDGPEYLINGAANGNRVILGALNEFILACAASGTGLMLYPHLRKHDESLALGYVCFRLFEAVVITVGAVWLIAKGFNAAAITPAPTTVAVGATQAAAAASRG